MSVNKQSNDEYRKPVRAPLFIEFATIRNEPLSKLEDLIKKDKVELFIDIHKIKRLRQLDVKQGKIGYYCWCISCRETDACLGYALVEPGGVAGDNGSLVRYYITPEKRTDTIRQHIVNYVLQSTAPNTSFLLEEQSEIDYFEKTGVVRRAGFHIHNAKQYVAFTIFKTSRNAPCDYPTFADHKTPHAPQLTTGECAGDDSIKITYHASHIVNSIPLARKKSRLSYADMVRRFTNL